MALDPYQAQVARLALALPEAEGFALAGGGAMLAHQLIERPTQDIEARALIDVDALAARFEHDLLLRLVAAKDAGFVPARMPAAITTAAGRDPAVYASLRVTGPALDQLRARARAWIDQLIE